MSDWQPLQIALNKGLDQSTVSNDADPTPQFTTAFNLDFGKKGGVRGRPGYVRATGGYLQRALTAAGQPLYTTAATLSATGYTAQAMFPLTDKRSERPGLVTNGRIFSYEDNQWVDRLGAGAMRVDRVADFQVNLAPGPAAFGFDPILRSMAYDFGPSNNNLNARFLSARGEQDSDALVTSQGTGNSCRLGTMTAMVHVAVFGGSANNLVLETRANGARALTRTVLANNAAVPTGLGDAPVICCDFDSSFFYVAYITTTAHLITILKVDNTGASVSAANVNYGAGTLTGLWVTNSSVADNRIVVTCTDSTSLGVSTTTLSMVTPMAFQNTVVIDATQLYTQAVCGAAVNSTGGAWIAATSVSGGLWLGRRSISGAAAATNSIIIAGTYYPRTGFTATRQGHAWYLQHQPIILNGRVLLGLNSLYAWNGANPGNYGTWMVVDLTDLWTGTPTGSRRTPPLVARGPMQGTAAPFNPYSATLAADGLSYRFPSADWRTFSAVLIPTGTSDHDTAGSNASWGLNEVRFEAPQVAHLGDTTIIGGSIPRGIARGAAFEMGFPFNDKPGITVTQGVAGAVFTVGASYTITAIWRWIDEAGQTHRSAPCPPVTVTAVTDGAGAARCLNVGITGLALTDRTISLAGDRGNVMVEVYMTQANPTANSLHQLASTTAAVPVSAFIDGGFAGVQFVTFANPPSSNAPALYTDIGIFSCRSVQADGGVVTVGKRCWVSDGDAVYGSRLGVFGANEVTSWSTDVGACVLPIPASAGRVVSLSNIDDKLVIFCERGIYWTLGDGPNDDATGPAVITPVRVSTLGIAGARASVYTPKGIMFLANFTNLSDTSVGGLWVIDGSMQCVQVSAPIRDYVNVTAELGYLPERQQIFVAFGNGSVQTFDYRAGQWSTWSMPSDAGGALITLACVAGFLWVAGSSAGGFTSPPNTGSDVTDVTTQFDMTLTTSPVPADGKDGASFARVRSVQLVGDLGQVTHRLDVSVVLDEDPIGPGSAAMSLLTFNPAGATGSRPADRYAPEFRLPVQKCSVIAITANARPAVATWSVLELQVKPAGHAPAHTRR